MADAIPDIVFSLGDNEERLVIIDDTEEVGDLTQLLRFAPGLMQPEAALTMAQAINHIAQGDAFDVIDNPDAFKTAYEAQIASEDPSEPWQEGVVRLVDYGTPDFDLIKAPRFEGSVLTFYAVDTFLKLPYRVAVDLNVPGVVAEDGTYKAMDLTPLDDPDDEDPDPEMSDEDRDFLKSLETAGSSD